MDIKRINELARKSKTVGLTKQEKIEQDKLRKEYILSFRKSLQVQLDNTYILDDKGNKSKLKKK